MQTKKNAKTVNIGTKDIQSFLNALHKGNAHAGDMRVSVEHFRLSMDMLKTKPAIIMTEPPNRLFRPPEEPRLFEQVAFCVDRQSRLMKGSYVEPSVTHKIPIGLLDEDEDSPSDREGESIWSAVRRLSRRKIGAVIIVEYSENGPAPQWTAKVYHAPGDPEELVRWNRQYSRQSGAPAHRGNKRFRRR